MVPVVRHDAPRKLGGHLGTDLVEEGVYAVGQPRLALLRYVVGDEFGEVGQLRREPSGQGGGDCRPGGLLG
jgi:hypothetical protein